MQGFIIYVLFFSFISPCLCTRLNVGTTNDIYNVMQYGAIGDGKSDDTQAFSKAWSSACTSSGMSTLVIPSEKSFMVTRVNFSGPCNAKILIQMEGRIVAPSKEDWKGAANLISMEYLNGLIVDGNGHGEVYGNGATWWKCRTCFRPGVLFFHACNGLNVRNLKISDSPKTHVYVNQCDGATFTRVSINSPATSPNTDGFGISYSTNILIQDSDIKSGDDCIAVNDGSTFINATRVTCGPGHGISVGSLGRNRTTEKVSDVHVRNCTFTGTANGARIKTVEGGSGYAKQISFEQIILVNVKNPIIIDQKYDPAIRDTSVLVSSVTYRGFTGTSATDVAIDLDCSSSGCYGIVLDENNIVSAQPGKKTSAFCRNAHGAATHTIPNVLCLSK
ncbi:unnamed protein product [Lathyrus oleraceus]|uniref:Polygalacturonase n=2 Tax=Pisum sativum TaxID=3888 RepID=A0A9D4XM59_PEA|nr:probable polygalacturonase At3g15720 [Pisum sativum]KAI5423092.1 hypothetical protein KIW84_046188 [Pisum sativum]